MPAPGTQLYFIALIPPFPVRDEVQTFKEYFRDHFHSKAALKSPPHITLHMPFEWKESKEEKLITALHEFSTGRKEFPVAVYNFSCFEPRVIYIDIKPSELLASLQTELHRFCKINLNLFNARYRDLPFHPHLTLAFRDLKKEEFAKAWAEFREKKYSADFLVNNICLLKHNGNQWIPYREFRF
jgi:2'-5' RNA ligase